MLSAFRFKLWSFRFLLLTPHKRIKAPRANFHTRSAAHRFIAKFKVDAVHCLVKSDLFLIILKQVDLVTAGGEVAQPHSY